MSSCAYSCADLATGIQPGSKMGITLVLFAYFDESGTHQNPMIFSFAGYLFTAKRIRRFERDWSRVLGTFDISAFHATDMESHAKGSEFENREIWTDARCDKLVGSLVPIINRTVLLGLRTAVNATGYITEFGLQLPKVRRAFRKLLAENAYMFCLTACLREMCRHCDHLGFPPTEHISCICDERSLRGTVLEVYLDVKAHAPWAKRLAGLTFASDNDALPLQAADLLAYHTRRRTIEQIHGRQTLRPAYNALRVNLHRTGGMNAEDARGLKRQLDAIIAEKFTG